MKKGRVISYVHESHPIKHATEQRLSHSHFHPRHWSRVPVHPHPATVSPSSFMYCGSLSVRLCSACEVSSLTALDDKDKNNKTTCYRKKGIM